MCIIDFIFKTKFEFLILKSIDLNDLKRRIGRSTASLLNTFSILIFRILIRNIHATLFTDWGCRNK